MSAAIYMQGITVEQSLSEIDSIVEKRINEKMEALRVPLKKYHYMTRKEVADYLRISLPTLNFWTKEGLLVSYKKGNRVLYRSDEIDEGVQKRKFSRGYKY